MMFISDAFADTTAAATSVGSANNSASLLLLLGFIVIFYFLLWRPQAKRAKELKNLINNLAKGDEVVTSGGLVGKITKLADDFISLAIADNIEVKVQRNAISSVLPKGTLGSV